MRHFLNIINEAAEPLDAALLAVGNYIQHNEATDLSQAAAVMKRYGYQEQFGDGRYFRALFHDVTAEDRARYDAVGDLHAAVQQDIRMDLSLGVQGFTTSLENAHQFINGVLWHAARRPEHTPTDPLQGLSSLIVVYEVEAPAASIVLSMRGLKAFLKATPQKDYGWRVLNNAINDMWDGYGSDDEVVIDTRAGVSVAGVHLYDSDAHSD